MCSSSLEMHRLTRPHRLQGIEKKVVQSKSQLAAVVGAGKAAAIAKVSAIGCNRFLLSAQIMASHKEALCPSLCKHRKLNPSPAREC